LKIQISTEIVGTTSTVFSYLIDTDKIIKWQTFLAETQQLSTGTIGVGSKFRNVLQHPGFDTSGIITLELTGEVLTFEQDKRLKVSGNSNVADMTIDYQLHQVDDITVIKQIADFELRGFLLRPISHLMGSFLEEQFQADLVNLKSLIESEHSEKD
jgi:hypothetical protein